MSRSSANGWSILKQPYIHHTSSKVRQVDAVERKLVFLAANERSAGIEIPIDDILEIHGDLVDYMEDM